MSGLEIKIVQMHADETERTFLIMGSVGKGLMDLLTELHYTKRVDPYNSAN